MAAIHHAPSLLAGFGALGVLASITVVPALIWNAVRPLGGQDD